MKAGDPGYSLCLTVITRDPAEWDFIYKTMSRLYAEWGQKHESVTLTSTDLSLERAVDEIHLMEGGSDTPVRTLTIPPTVKYEELYGHVWRLVAKALHDSGLTLTQVEKAMLAMQDAGITVLDTR